MVGRACGKANGFAMELAESRELRFEWNGVGQKPCIETTGQGIESLSASI